MKEQDIRDFFHDYRPKIGDNDEFMDRLTVQMDAEDARQQQLRIIPLHRRVLPWAAGIAACVTILIGSVTFLRYIMTTETDGIASVEVDKLEQQENKPKAENIMKIKETPVMGQITKENVKVKTKRRKKRNTIVGAQNTTSQRETTTVMANNEVDHVVQEPKTVTTPDPFQTFEDRTRDIRLRGERLHHEVAMLMNNQ